MIGKSISERELIARIIICSRSTGMFGLLKIDTNDIIETTLEVDVSEEQGNFILEINPHHVNLCVTEATSPFCQLMHSVALENKVYVPMDSNALTYHKLAAFSVIGQELNLA
jgi:hypothetical protein